MDPLTILGLVANIIQFVDFSGNLISASLPLCRSNEGALTENIIKTTTNDLILLNGKLKGAATSNDAALKRLCESCNSVADQLLKALDKIRVNSENQTWRSIMTALRSIISQGEIYKLEQQLAKLREELNLRIIVDLRCVSDIGMLTMLTRDMAQGSSLSIKIRAVRVPQQARLNSKEDRGYYHQSR